MQVEVRIITRGASPRAANVQEKELEIFRRGELQFVRRSVAIFPFVFGDPSFHLVHLSR